MVAQIPYNVTRTNNKLVVWQSAIAGLSYVAGGITAVDVVPTRWAALFFILVGGMQAATAAYVASAKPVQTPVEVVTVDVTTP